MTEPRKTHLFPHLLHLGRRQDLIGHFLYIRQSYHFLQFHIRLVCLLFQLNFDEVFLFVGLVNMRFNPLPYHLL